jgi:hypothetical protein
MRFQPGFRYGASTAVIGGALALLAGETDGFAIDATTADGGTVAVINTGDPTDNLSNVILDASNLTQSGTSPKMVHHLSSPYARWSAHNMFLNSGAPATQNVTLVVGFVYTVTVTGAGGGSITGSAGASGVATTGSPATFTATTTTGTFTYAATLTTIQLNRGSVATPYLATTGAIRIGIPQSYDAAAAQYGILVEPAATNLLLYSQEQANAAWTISGAGLTVTDNNAVAPDGTTTAARYAHTDANSFNNSPTTGLTISSGVNYTFSGYAKPDTTSWVRILVAEGTGGTNSFRAFFDITNGTVGTTQSTGTWTYVSSSITPVGGGYYRISVTGTTADTTAFVFMRCANADNSVPANGNAAWFWGAQLELGSVATSYTHTLGSTVTRAIDLLQVLNASLPFSATVGSAYMKAKMRATDPTAVNVFFSFNDNTLDERIQVYRGEGVTDDFTLYIVDGGSDQTVLNGGAITLGTTAKVGVQWAANDAVIYGDGVQIGVDTSLSLPTVNRLHLGARVSDTSRSANGYIYEFVYWPRSLSDAELDTKTT